ncbi:MULTISPECIES: hypothetical protein [Leptospira]|uniref:hypothetical protein n=1 Tax=Leptospira TaxID=171 RepID=UPI00046C537A|nr:MULTISPECIES: hypothetical protein [Leptospira]KXZ27305.1 hypothetical protein AYB32_15040 [Leptospira kirschneri]KXZ34265.1 hypothetical protein AYB34_08605 [Leptospira sp. ZV016]
MKEYCIYFTQLNGGSLTYSVTSRSLLGAKQKASRIFNSYKPLEFLTSAISIQDGSSWVAHKFIGSKKWSSFA